MGGPAVRASLALGLAVLSGCTRDEPRPARPAPGPSPIASAAPSAPPAPSVPPLPPAVPAERLLWEVPPAWRDLGVPLHGVTKAHYQALVEDPRARMPEEVEVFVVHHEGAAGATPEARMADVLRREAEPFTKIDWRKSDTRVVGGRKLELVELHGTMRELVPVPPDYERSPVARPHRAEITAFFPTKTFPYRIALHGREDLVDRARADFYQFLDSLRIENEATP